MGIPRLTKALRPYAASGPLESHEVVIDGPAFCYHIYHVFLSARKQSRNQFETAITSLELANCALAWLDTLRASKLTIRNIYFDGFLPSTKYDTRIERLIRQTQQLKAYHAAFPITPCSSPASLSPPTSHELFTCPPVPERLTRLPPVPFLVPAILEALRYSAEYRNITKVVPGEADEYCAASLKHNGGIAFTGDSDLLVHDIGQGSIVFFKDIERDSGALKSLIYHPAEISARLELPAPYGLQSFAFELKMDVQASFPELLARTKTSQSTKNNPEDFAEFKKEYGCKLGQSSVDDEGSLEVLQSLDPRISEYVLQIPLFAKLAGQAPSGITPHIFLPFVFGSPTRTSAWEMSQTVRQLAYGLVSLVLPQGQIILTVFEHRRQETESSGRELQLPVHDVPEACQTLLTLLTQIELKLPRLSKTEFWIAVSVCEDIEWCHQHSKPATGPLVRHQAILLEDKSHKNLSWEILQFLAQLQSTFYSFRILKFVLALVVSRFVGTLPRPILQLRDQLDSLPPLADFPELGQALPIIKMIKDRDIAKVAHNILGIEVPQITVTPQVSRREAKRKQKAGNDMSQGRNRSSNPFALLETD